MKLLSLLIPFALAQDYSDAEKKKPGKGPRPSKVESFDCNSVAIGDAIAGAVNVEVHGCLDFELDEVVGDINREVFPAKRKGALAMCKFKCAAGFKPGVTERALAAINAERAKKNKKPKKPKKGGKKKRKPGKVKPPKKGKKGGIRIIAKCNDGEDWSFVKGKVAMAATDLACEIAKNE